MIFYTIFKRSHILLIVVMLLAACQKKDFNTNVLATQISKSLHALTAMTEMKINTGESFEISLDSNPSTGFSWELAAELDEGMLVEIENVFASQANDDDHPMVGQGGKEFWTFQALKKGKATIKMKYCQPFDANNPAEEKTIVVHIQ